VAKRSPPIELPFTNGFYLSRSKPLSSQRCVNWYPQDNAIPSLSQSSLYGTPGIKQILDDLEGIGRGAKVFNDVLYVVAGESLYKIVRTVNPDGTDSISKEYIGIIEGEADVIMDKTALQLAIVVPYGKSYVYTESTEILTDISGASNFLGPAIDVVAINSYFVFAQADSRIIFQSNVNNGLVYGALDYWQITQFPTVKGLMVYRNQLYVMGESVTVPFYDAEQLEFSFRPIPNSVIDSGLAGQYSKSLFRGSFVYLGSGENAERGVWLFNGGQPEKLSTEPIDYIIQNETPENINSARIERHSQNGAEFVILSIGDWCFVYDLVSSRWHERRSRIPYGSSFIDVPWRAKAITQAYNRVFVLDSDSGLLGELDDLTYNEYGISIHAYIITQPFINLGQRTRVPAIEAYFDVGNTDTLQLMWSDDGGYNWSDTISRSLGAIGEYGRRVVFDRIGAFSNTRMLRIDYTGQNPRSFNALMAATL
jgi:hypothetical protein